MSATADARPLVDVRVDDVATADGPPPPLDGVSVHVRYGEFFTFVGPPHSGKTAVLRAAAGFLLVARGRIFVGEDDVTHTPARARDMGYVFHEGALWPHLAVREHVARSDSSSTGSRRRTRDAGSRSRGHSRWSRACSCSTSHSRTSIPSIARRCGSGWRRCIGISPSRRSAPHTGGRSAAAWPKRSGPRTSSPCAWSKCATSASSYRRRAGTGCRWRGGDFCDGHEGWLVLRPARGSLAERAEGRGPSLAGQVALRVFEGARYVYEIDVGVAAAVRVEVPSTGDVRVFRLGEPVRVEVSSETVALVRDR